ncbi:uncharacterized protein LOC131671927 [Phymastichus coffea]|uniref:uncharacterized protein LOC131671927 n=1 Tax=Phymastichus coffea TaxID=108790 RepID=UPI00273C81D4|nr:uncharacterized protein LOC131671927 [Phymastichus coffea]
MNIPRLELCAASVLTKLFIKVRNVLDFPIHKVTFWSDSVIALCWLKKAPHLLRPFESNRVAEIQKMDDQVSWYHVPSGDNPADSLSRGQLPEEFMKNPLWNSGPKWLLFSDTEWPKQPEQLLPSGSTSGKETCLLSSTSNDISFIYSRFSSFKHLIKVVAFMLRWKNLKSLDERRGELRPLEISELETAERKIVAMIQRERFPKELKLLATAEESKGDDNSVPFRKATSLDELNPFLDEHDMIRVGGRLKRSDLIYTQRHPVLLPSRHHVTDLIIRDTHDSNLHAGIQATLYIIRQRY